MKETNSELAGAFLLFEGAQFWLINSVAEAAYLYFVVKTGVLSKIGAIGAPP
jgi:hypothetical protein